MSRPSRDRAPGPTTLSRAATFDNLVRFDGAHSTVYSSANLV